MGQLPLAVVISLASVVSWMPVAAQDLSPAEAEAVTEAEEWLRLIDSGEYGESWTRAAPLFQAALTQAEWEGTAQGVIRQTGRSLSREIENVSHTTALPEAPPGEYVVVQYQSSFQNIASAAEVVALRQEGERGWLVAGYFVLPR